MIEVETVRELLSKATPGPWAYKAGTLKHYAHSTDPGEDFGVSLQEMHWQDGREVPAEGNARLIAAAPDIAALALAQAAEIARMREAVRHYDIGAWRHSARGGDDYPEPEWVTKARAMLKATP